MLEVVYDSPVGRIQSNSVDFHQHIIISQFRERDFLDFGFGVADDFDCFHRARGHGCGVSSVERILDVME